MCHLFRISLVMDGFRHIGKSSVNAVDLLRRIYYLFIPCTELIPADKSATNRPIVPTTVSK
jgi:hypothetical protein